jgi:hypothetical protein
LQEVFVFEGNFLKHVTTPCFIINALILKPCILFNLYSECLTEEALEGFGDFKIGGQIINSVKYADGLVLLAEEEKVLQDMIDKLIENGRCCGMEMNVEKTKVTTITSKNYDRPKTTGECEIF